MTRKRFVKIMMSYGYARNTAEFMTHAVQMASHTRGTLRSKVIDNYQDSYDELYRLMCGMWR